MKKQLLMLALLFASFAATAQLSTGEMPPSFSDKDLAQTAVKTITLAKPDLERVIAEDESEEAMFKPRRFGVIVPCHKDFFENAQSVKTKEGTLYRLAVEVPEAQALVFYSDRFRLPKGGKLFIYNEDRSKVLGSFTAINNHELQTFATEYLEGDKIIFEYLQPEGETERALIDITEIGYAYRDIIEKASEEYRSSGSCNVNVNCSEGDNFRKQQRAVARIQIRMNAYYMGWCTGTLVNNTNYDRTPYLLTAAHCIEDVQSSSYYSQFVFYFNYETSGCSTPTSEPSRSKSLTGATLKAYDNTHGNAGSDFCLLLLNNDVPQSYNPYWAGWDRRDQAVTQGVCIHHPAGDVKKISTFGTRIQSVRLGASTATHWKVVWKATTNGYGITEGGSSGSALFNSDGLVIGDLTGGDSGCDVPNSSKLDYYGKLSYSWASNGSANNRKLQPWLDPTNSGVQMIWGMDYSASVDEVSVGEKLALVSPNPTKDEVNVRFAGSYSDILLQLYDNAGRLVMEKKPASSVESTTINLRNYAEGVYVLKIYADGKQSARKIIIQR